MLVGYIVYYFALGCGFFLLGLAGGWLAATIMRLPTASRGRDILLGGWAGLTGGVTLIFISYLVYDASPFVIPICAGTVLVWLAYRKFFN